MIKEIQYTSIKRVMDNLMEHPLLRDLTLDQAIRYTIRFIGLHGYPKLYKDKIITVHIDNYRGVLPCDLVSIIQVKDVKTGICLRSMSDDFSEGIKREYSDGYTRHQAQRPTEYNKHTGEVHKDWYISPRHKFIEEPAFKTQGRIIYTSFCKGCVEISYKAIPVDENNFPLLIDNENYLAALEAFIKVQIFTIKFDTGKINANVLQNAQQEYAFRAAELMDEFTIPSVSEMETLSRAYNTLLTDFKSFDKSFSEYGSREYLRRH